MPIKYTEAVLRDVVSRSDSYAHVIRNLGLRQTGGTQANLVRRIAEHNIDTSHFAGQAWRKGGTAPNKRPPEHYLVVRQPGSRRMQGAILQRALMESGVERRCSLCLLRNWRGKPLRLEVDHINGDCLDNRIENLRLLCPNCHNQTETYGRRASV